jgi:MHS family shikimate/dehydroshikimate transporter-like MFS transporter
MGIATALIGLLPTYSQIGIWAPILLIAIRVLQGFGAGAEYGGAVLVSGESASARRGLFASFPAAAVDFSFVLATGVLLLFTLMPADQFLAWGWRIPFLLSLVVVIPGMFIRAKVAETADYAKAQATRQATRTPIRDLLRDHPGKLVAAMGINFVPNLSYVFQIFAFAYVTQTLHLATSMALIGGVLSGVFGSVAALGFGALADRIGARWVMTGGALFCVLFAFPFFMLLDTGSPYIIWTAVVVGHLGERAVFGVQPSFYLQLFPVQIRYSGIAVAREVTGALIAGPLPLVATALLAWAHAAWPVALLVVVYGLVTTLAVQLAPVGDAPADVPAALANAV